MPKHLEITHRLAPNPIKKELIPTVFLNSNPIDDLIDPRKRGNRILTHVVLSIVHLRIKYR